MKNRILKYIICSFLAISGLYSQSTRDNSTFKGNKNVISKKYNKAEVNYRKALSESEKETRASHNLGNVLFEKSDVFFKNKFFPKAQLNYAENLLKKNNEDQNDILIKKKEFQKKFNIKIDYLEIRNEKNLTSLIKNKKIRLFVAYYINKVRLIDNF